MERSEYLKLLEKFNEITLDFDPDNITDDEGHLLAHLERTLRGVIAAVKMGDKP